MTTVETAKIVCENCDQHIGRLEKQYTFEQHIVCAACWYRLTNQLYVVAGRAASDLDYESTQTARESRWQRRRETAELQFGLVCKFAKAAFYFFGTVGALTLLVGGLVHFANKPRPVVSTLAVSGASLADQLHVEPITRTLRSGESVKFFIIENRTAKPIMIKDVMFNREFHAIRGASNLEYFGPSPYTPWPLTLYPEERAFAFVRSTVRLHASWNGPPRVTELRIMTDKGDADFAVNE